VNDRATSSPPGSEAESRDYLSGIRTTHGEIDFLRPPQRVLLGKGKRRGAERWPDEPPRGEVARAMRALTFGGRAGGKVYRPASTELQVGVVAAVLFSRQVARSIVATRLREYGVEGRTEPELLELAAQARSRMYALLLRHFGRPVDFHLRWLGRF
jgi:hypothetical protein